jgi:hypothetical protein
MELFTDASDVGIAGYYQGEWFSIQIEEALRDETHIGYREMLAIVAAATVWGSCWAGKNILIHCDNMGVVHSLKKGSCKCKDTMHLIRKLFFIAARYQFDFKVVYVSTNDNTIADPLSRLDLRKFREMAPEAKAHPECESLDKLDIL